MAREIDAVCVSRVTFAMPPGTRCVIGRSSGTARIENPVRVDTPAFSSDVAFSPSVKAVQARKGSRDQFEQMEKDGGWRTQITLALTQFIEAQISLFLATASAAGQPYVQHRGGPPGFLKVLDERTLGFVDFAGNRQYITLGNLAENPRAQLFLMDYTNRRRVKLWGTARVVEGDPALTAQLMPMSYRARASQVILFSVTAWDTNCQQHIPQRYEAADVAAAVAERDRRIAELEQELAELRGGSAELS